MLGRGVAGERKASLLRIPPQPVGMDGRIFLLYSYAYFFNPASHKSNRVKVDVIKTSKNNPRIKRKKERSKTDTELLKKILTLKVKQEVNKRQVQKLEI